MPKEESDLEKLKKEYSKLQKKYSLPDFDKMNRDFQIEKMSDCESEYLIREIKKSIGDKFFNYLRFIENLLNPSGSGGGSTFIYSVVKTISIDDRSRLLEMYKKMSKGELKFIELDIEFSEQKEADFINEFYKLWQEIKPELLSIIQSVEKNWDTKIEGKSKGYFG